MTSTTSHLTGPQGYLGDRFGRSPGTTLLSAAMAGATSTVVLQPLEVVRSRISCDSLGRYKQGIPAALVSMVRQEGPLVLYSGLPSSLLAIMPEAAVTYGQLLTQRACIETLLAQCG